MAKLIEKSAVVAEIKRLKEVLQNPAFESENWWDYVNGGNKIAKEILSFLDTLEVIEVDLEMEKIKNIEKQCPFRKITCEKYEHHPLECNGACGFVCDRITLEKKHQHDIKNVPVDEEKLRNDRSNTI